MSQFFGLVSHEFGMSIRRPGLWIAYGLLMLFYTGSILLPGMGPGGTVSQQDVIPLANLWQFAGMFAFQFNLFLPIVVGILAADRLSRDFRLGVRELQNGTPLRLWSYTLGKYTGVLGSLYLPVLLWVIALGLLLPALKLAPWEMAYAMPVAGLVITLPAFAFVTAFSLACPLVIPLRVYQILFVGYWFWGNFLSPTAFPTLNGTLLTAGGMIAYQGIFGGYPLSTADQLEYTASYASINLVVLALCILAVLGCLHIYLAQKARRA